jgi:hypothetical protein
MDESQATRLRFAPGPGPPRDRKTETEHRQQRPTRDELHDSRAVRLTTEDARADVVGEQPRPSLDVVREAEDEVRRRRHVDPDGGAHGLD